MNDEERTHQEPGKDKNVLYFPDLEKRKSIEKEKRNEEKQRNKEQREKEALEEQYRAEYRARRVLKAGNQSEYKLHKPVDNGPAPFINWDKIPPFCGACVLVFVVAFLALNFLTNDVQYLQILYEFSFVPASYTIEGGSIISKIVAPVTSLFLHSGWMHLLMNSMMMIIMGAFFERQFGMKRTAIFFFVSGFAGHVAFFALAPYSTVPVIGASGGINGLFAATMMAMHSFGMMGHSFQQRGPLPFLLFWTVILVLTGVFSPNIAWQSHVGGFWMGALLFHLMRKGKLRF